jgi:metal-responsive CopG/Arc/MetJ family transcriptional regulator
MPKERSHDRAKGQTQISLSLPAELVADIDALAKADDRSRSSWIRRELIRKVAQEMAKKNISVLPPAVAAAAEYTSSTPELKVAETETKPVIYRGRKK